MIRSWLAMASVALVIQATTVVTPQFIGRYDWLLLFTLPLLALGAATITQGRLTLRQVAELPPKRV